MDNHINICVVTVFCGGCHALDQYMLGQSELCNVKKAAFALMLSQVCCVFLQIHLVRLL